MALKRNSSPAPGSSKFDQVRVQEHPGRRSEVQTVFLPVGLFLGGIPFEVHGKSVGLVY
jgi:hypothetical protein